MKEIPVGDEIRIRCVEDKGGNICDKCAFTDICDSDFYGCSWKRRSDNKNVHFELVETTEPSASARLTESQKQTIIDSFYTCQDKWVAKRTIKKVEEILNQKDKDNEIK